MKMLAVVAMLLLLLLQPRAHAPALPRVCCCTQEGANVDHVQLLSLDIPLQIQSAIEVCSVFCVFVAVTVCVCVCPRVHRHVSMSVCVCQRVCVSVVEPSVSNALPDACYISCWA